MKVDTVQLYISQLFEGLRKMDMSQMQPWMDTRAAILNGDLSSVHEYTYLLEALTIGYFDKNGLPRTPARIKNENKGEDVHISNMIRKNSEGNIFIVLHVLSVLKG